MTTATAASSLLSNVHGDIRIQLHHIVLSPVWRLYRLHAKMQQQQNERDGERMAQKRQYKIFRTNLIGAVTSPKKRGHDRGVLYRLFHELNYRCLRHRLRWLVDGRLLRVLIFLTVEQRHD